MVHLTEGEEARLADLKPEDLAQLWALRATLEARMAREHILPFIKLYNPDNYIVRDFHRKLAECLEALERFEIRFLAVFMPPRHGKSMLCSETFPAWYVGRHPDRHIILASYAEGLAQAFNRRVRDKVMDPRWPFPGVRVRPDLAGVEEFGTTTGGTCRAKGVGGGITGRGAHLLVIDDPVADREAADSELTQERNWLWWTDVAATRLESTGGVVLPCTRWGDRDLPGRILNSPGAQDWTVLMMPAIAEPNVGSDIKDIRELITLDREPGSALFPERYDELELRRIERSMSPLSWNALYQQRPSSAEGNLFKRDWWNYWTPGVPPAVQGKRIVRLPKRFVSRYHFVDSAFKTGVANDFSVCATWGKDELDNFYLLDLWRARVEFPTLVDRLERTYAKLRVPICIEDKASGQSAIQVLKSGRKARVVAAKYKGDHADRAEAITDIVESGKVYLPYEATWLEAFVEEHAKFPTGAHDDQVDTTSMALLKLDKIKGRAKPSGYELGEVKPTAKAWDVFREHSDALEKRLEDREELGRFV